jgi:hypothetical protein
LDYEYAANTDPLAKGRKVLMFITILKAGGAQPAFSIDRHYQTLGDKSTGVSVRCSFTPQSPNRGRGSRCVEQGASGSWHFGSQMLEL